MRRRTRSRKKYFIGACFAAMLITPMAAAAMTKAAPKITSTVGRITANNTGVELIDGEEDFLSYGYGYAMESEKSVQADTKRDSEINPGPKPYPESLDNHDGDIYKTEFGKYSGSKYFSLDNGGQVKNLSDKTNGTLLEESRKQPEFKIELNSEPQVLIMHTHTTESFEPYERDFYDSSFNYRTTDPQKNVVMIGDQITKQLEDAGINVIHNSTIHDYPSYNGSYDRSAATVKKILEDNPSIKVVLDIHRDAISSNGTLIQPTIEIDGKKSAQIMIISGCDDGTMDMPNYMKNFRFAALLQQQIENNYPGLARPILFDYRKYNQNLTTGSLLIEVGTHGNTLEQVSYAGELFGKSLADALKQLT